MFETLAIITLAAGLVTALGIIFFERRRSGKDIFSDLEEEIQLSSSLDEETKIRLKLESKRAKEEAGPWYHAAASSMGVVAFVAALAAVMVQAFQNAALQSQSTLEAEQLQLFRAQNERAMSVVDPIVQSILDDFDQRGSTPSQNEKEVLQFAIDRWLSQGTQEGEEYRQELLKAFRAALLANDYASAVQIADRLGVDIDKANKVDQIGLIEYLYISGVGPSVQPHLCRALADTTGIPPTKQVKLFAIALSMGLIDDIGAVRSVARAERVSEEIATQSLRRQVVALRKSREQVLSVLRGDGTYPTELASSDAPRAVSGC